MATGAACRALFSFLVVLAVSASDGDDYAPAPEETMNLLQIRNNCSHAVAPVIAPKQGSPPIDFKPQQLPGFDYYTGIPLPHGWSGRIWARTGCPTDGNARFTCATGDCGSGRLECDSSSVPAPAATVAEFALGEKGGTDAYGITLADGYNLPMVVEPYYKSHGGPCVVDLDSACPADQQVKASGRVVACKPSGNSGALENACPTAKSYSVAAAASSSSCAVFNNNYIVTL